MFQILHRRGAHYLLLTLVALALFLPHLGAATLWDIDEGNNVEAYREMLAADNWHVPTFNFQLRVDKPALLYWLQIFCSMWFGVGELAGRLPSALAALVTVLVTYEFGRKVFGAMAGLCAGLALASSFLFCAAAHFANPDALLTASTTLAFFFFWCGQHKGGRVWFVPISAMMGLAVLAKGPVGLVLPMAVIGLYLLRAGRLRELFRSRAALGTLAFLAVALPWYIWVGVDTKFAFVRGFISTHNVGRFLSPMENHGGPVFYYLIVLAVGFAPWSIFLLPVCWVNYREKRLRTGSSFMRGLWRIHPDAVEADRARAFAWCWIAVYVVFFTISRTKLPNYILPIYPAVALLMGDFLDRWRRGTVELPDWMPRLSFAALAALGLGVAMLLVAVSGMIPIGALQRRPFPGMERWAAVGMILELGAIAADWCERRRYRSAMIASITMAATSFLVVVMGWASPDLNAFKAPRSLARMIHDRQSEREIRIAAFGYFQPSLVYYCQREVVPLSDETQAKEFLRTPLQVFLVIPAQTWERLAGETSEPRHVLGRHWDMYRGYDVVVVTNR